MKGYDATCMALELKSAFDVALPKRTVTRESFWNYVHLWSGLCESSKLKLQRPKPSSLLWHVKALTADIEYWTLGSAFDKSLRRLLLPAFGAPTRPMSAMVLISR